MKKIVEAILTPKVKGKIRGTSKKIGLETELFLRYDNGETEILTFDYEKYASNHLTKLYIKERIDQYEQKELF